MSELKINQQVVVRRRVGSFPTTNEIKVGTIQAFQDAAGNRNPEGKFAAVSMPAPGGRVVRSVVPVASLEPVSDRFKRAVVQTNPAFRQVQ